MNPILKHFLQLLIGVKNFSRVYQNFSQKENSTYWNIKLYLLKVLKSERMDCLDSTHRFNTLRLIST